MSGVTAVMTQFARTWSRTRPAWRGPPALHNDDLVPDLQPGGRHQPGGTRRFLVLLSVTPGVRGHAVAIGSPSGGLVRLLNVGGEVWIAPIWASRDPPRICELSEGDRRIEDEDPQPCIAATLWCPQSEVACSRRSRSVDFLERGVSVGADFLPFASILERVASEIANHLVTLEVRRDRPHWVQLSLEDLEFTRRAGTPAEVCRSRPLLPIR